jgi:hypothetical protein
MIMPAAGLTAVEHTFDILILALMERPRIESI